MAAIETAVATAGKQIAKKVGKYAVKKSAKYAAKKAGKSLAKDEKKSFLAKFIDGLITAFFISLKAFILLVALTCSIIVGVLSQMGLGVIDKGYESGDYSGAGGVGSTQMKLDNGFNMSIEEINAWIDAKAPSNSLMKGRGKAFYIAAEQTGLDVRYIVAHAAHETAWGTSNIANNKYNFFGIGAFDSDPYNMAFNWDTPDKGIINGAGWIYQNYTKRGQNTLHSMNHHNTHSYATDPRWGEKIAAIMKTAPKTSSSQQDNDDDDNE